MRIEQLTFSRFLAAFAVVFFHFGKNIFPFSHPFLYFMVKEGGLSVGYFFILSGFVMMIAYGDRQKINAADYFKNRVARIYPVYFIGILMVVAFTLIALREIPSFYEIFLNIFAIQAWIPPKLMSLNFPGWSLSVEFFFYFMFPFLFNHFYQKKKFLTIFIVVIVFWLASIWFFNWGLKGNINMVNEKTTSNFLNGFPVLHLNEFMIGNLAGIYFREKLQNAYRNYDGAIFLIVIVFIILLKFQLPVNYNNGFMAVIFVPFILFLSLNTGFITKLFNHKLLIYLGEISYSIYILHYPVFIFTKWILEKINIIGDLKVFCIYIVILLSVSAFSYSYIEAPLRKKIKNLKFSF